MGDKLKNEAKPDEEQLRPPCPMHVPIAIEFQPLAPSAIIGASNPPQQLRATRLFCFTCGMTIGLKPDFFMKIDAEDQ